MLEDRGNRLYVVLATWALFTWAHMGGSFDRSKGPFEGLAPFKLTGTAAAGRSQIFWVNESYLLGGAAEAALARGPQEGLRKASQTLAPQTAVFPS
jgi:hypothetical protein